MEPEEQKVIGTDKSQRTGKLLLSMLWMTLGSALFAAGAVVRGLTLPGGIASIAAGFLAFGWGAYSWRATAWVYSQTLILREESLTVWFDRSATRLPWVGVKWVCVHEEVAAGRVRPTRRFGFVLKNGQEETILAYVLREYDEWVLKQYLREQIKRSEGRIISNLVPATTVWVM